MNKYVVILKEKINHLYTTGAMHVTLGSFLTKFVAFFGSIFVVRLLTKEQYGLLGYVENIYGYALVVAGFGLSYSLLRYVILADDEKKGTVFRYVVKWSVIINVLISITIIFVNRFVNYPDGFKNAMYYIPLIAVLLPIQDLFNDGLFALRATFRNKEFAYWSTIVAVLLIIGRIVGAKIGNIGGVLWSRIIINLVACVSILILCMRLLPVKKIIELSHNETKEINKYAFQYMITNGLWAVFMLNDLFILGNMISDASVIADYKVAYVLPGNLIIFSNAIGIYVGPYFTKNENNASWVRKNYKTVFLVSLAIASFVALIVFIFAKPLIVLMYGVNYLNVVPLMRILLIAAVLNAGLRYTTANILAAMGQVKYNMLVSAFGMALQIVLDIIFINFYQTLGVAYSSCIVYAFMAIMLFIIFYNKYYRNSGKESSLD